MFEYEWAGVFAKEVEKHGVLARPDRRVVFEAGVLGRENRWVVRVEQQDAYGANAYRLLNVFGDGIEKFVEFNDFGGLFGET